MENWLTIEDLEVLLFLMLILAIAVYLVDLWHNSSCLSRCRTAYARFRYDLGKCQCGWLFTNGSIRWFNATES